MFKLITESFRGSKRNFLLTKATDHAILFVLALFLYYLSNGIIILNKEQSKQ